MEQFYQLAAGNRRTACKRDQRIAAVVGTVHAVAAETKEETIILSLTVKPAVINIARKISRGQPALTNGLMKKSIVLSLAAGLVLLLACHKQADLDKTGGDTGPFPPIAPGRTVPIRIPLILRPGIR